MGDHYKDFRTINKQKGNEYNNHIGQRRVKERGDICTGHLEVLIWSQKEKNKSAVEKEDFK